MVMPLPVLRITCRVVKSKKEYMCFRNQTVCFRNQTVVFSESDRAFSKSDRMDFESDHADSEIRPCGFRNQTVVRAFPESDCVILESDRAFEIRLCICHDATMVYLVYLPWPSICTMVPPIYIPDTLWQHPAHGPPAIQL